MLVPGSRSLTVDLGQAMLCRLVVLLILCFWFSELEFDANGCFIISQNFDLGDFVVVLV